MAMKEEETTETFLDTLEGELAFFRSLMRARPVGIHRHFHAMVIRNAIQRDTGRWIPMDEIWVKLRACYDLDLLENIETDGFEVTGNKSGSNGAPPRSPSPSENLASHPYFRAEFSLPDDPLFDDMISRRRMRASVSSASPAPSLYQEKPQPSTRSSKRTKKPTNMAGLIGGDSDSSALTQESGDESVAPTPATGTDGATEYADGDGEHEQSPEASSSKHPRKGQKVGRRNSNSSKAKGAPPPNRGVKKRKR